MHVVELGVEPGALPFEFDIFSFCQFRVEFFFRFYDPKKHLVLIVLKIPVLLSL